MVKYSHTSLRPTEEPIMKKRLRLLSAGLAVLASLSALTACRTELTPPPPTEEDSSIQAPPSDGTAAPTDPPIELPEQPPMESIEYYQNQRRRLRSHVVGKLLRSRL